MNEKYNQIAIALAGICQNSMLVTQLANTGVCNAQLYELSIKSLFNESPKTTEDVFGGVKNVKIGLQILEQVFSAGSKQQMEIVRYLFGTLAITSKIFKNQTVLSQIEQRLNHVSTLYQHIDESVIHEHSHELSYSLAGIYSDIVSPQSSKIKVIGKIDFLQNLLIQAKVRTALLGCVRAGILWYQIGGNRLQFIFSRNKLRTAAKYHLTEIDKMA